VTIVQKPNENRWRTTGRGDDPSDRTASRAGGSWSAISYGGAVIHRSREQSQTLPALVYIAAFAPPTSAESVKHASLRTPPPRSTRFRRSSPPPRMAFPVSSTRPSSRPVVRRGDVDSQGSARVHGPTRMLALGSRGAERRETRSRRGSMKAELVPLVTADDQDGSRPTRSDSWRRRAGAKPTSENRGQPLGVRLASRRRRRNSS